ncbi:MAG: hypothetical protein MZV64_34205 [Ignavibacteriales bacterium]|nr:hypothetical protein [Ignavibacteriales bacterium]
MRGHAIECRINAEDPVTFAPSPGKIDFLVLPGGEGIRVDSAAYGGWVVPPNYDSLLAKIIAYAPTRDLAIDKMRAALETTTIVGIKTNIPLHLDILSNSDFLAGRYNTQFMDEHLAAKAAEEEGRPDVRPRSERAPGHDDREAPAVVLEDVLVDAQVEPPLEGDGDRPLRTDQEQDEDLVLDLQPGIRVDAPGHELGDFADEGADVRVRDGLIDRDEVEALGTAEGFGIPRCRSIWPEAVKRSSSPGPTSIEVSTQPASAATATVFSSGGTADGVLGACDSRPGANAARPQTAAPTARNVRILILPLIASPFRSARVQDLDDGPVNASVRGHDAGGVQGERASLEVRDPAARFHDQEGPRRHVPGLELELPEAVEPAAGDVGQVEGRGAAPADGLGPDDEPAPMVEVVHGARPDVVRESRRQQAPAQVRDGGDTDGRAVQEGPRPPRPGTSRRASGHKRAPGPAGRRIPGRPRR